MNIKAHLSRWWATELEPEDVPDLAELNGAMEHLSANQRIERAVELLPGNHVLTSSFGAQAAVMLHLVNTIVPGVPVVLLDTGYLFPETYGFIDRLTDRLKLNLKVFRADSSPAWQETRFGKLWNQGLVGIERYNRINKREPLDRALNELQAGTWFAGLRRAQAQTRSQIAPIEFKRGRYKVHPLFDWSDRDIGQYLGKHHLPYHPLWEKGYLSIGDWHTTRSLAEVDSMEELRFFGLKRECGLHEE
ncbi:MAG TPA: phosphoadenylyl-sulfate reductase [Steroidobacteraceae bacterium]|jgi:phosphoadenosine phosphosulfate reductase|nr:phosphoadenylyl-sulfate reductase [Steroidobacteraceae bacterium]